MLPCKGLYWDMHGLIFETSIWLLAGSTRFLTTLLFALQRWKRFHTLDTTPSPPGIQCNLSSHKPIKGVHIESQATIASYNTYTPILTQLAIMATTSAGHNVSHLYLLHKQLQLDPTRVASVISKHPSGLSLPTSIRYHPRLLQPVCVTVPAPRRVLW